MNGRQAWILLLLAIPIATAVVFGEPPQKTPRAALRLPEPIVFQRSADAPSPVVFRHQTHVRGVNPRCTECHPAPFRMLSPSRQALHREMDAGRSCGTCHDGHRAFSTQDGDRCDACHAGDLK